MPLQSLLFAEKFQPPEPVRESSAYFCRVCWNSKFWRYPTGEAAKLESKNSYATHFGFGLEEWLNRPEWTIDGRCYAFLQPDNKSRENKLKEILHLTLIARNPERRVVLVGEIGEAHILTRAEATSALLQFRENGWHATMLEDLERVGASCSPLVAEIADPREPLNCRTRPEELRLYLEPRPVPANHRLFNLGCYQLSAVRPGDRLIDRLAPT